MNEVASSIALAASFYCYTSSLYPAPRSPLVCPLRSLHHHRHPARVHVAHPLWLVFDRDDDDTMHFVSNATIDRTTTGQFVRERGRDLQSLCVFSDAQYILLPSRFYMRIFVVHIHFRSNSILVETWPEMRGGQKQQGDCGRTTKTER